MDKIADFSQIEAMSRQYKDAGKTIVFTNGCFDILHAGHVEYLKHAATFGQKLILGLNSDVSVKLIKGDKRPIIGQDYRSVVMAALECIEHVVLFDEPDPGRLIETINPDVLVKGADWPEDQIIGARFVKAHGGRIERIAFEHDISTTKIIQRIGQLYEGKF